MRWDFKLAPMLAAAAAVGLAAGVGYFNVSWSLLKAEKAKEKETILRIVDGFVGVYSELRREHLRDDAPVPAAFRARAIHAFNATAPEVDAIRIAMVGFPDRAIESEPLDAEMASAIREFAGSADPRATAVTLATAAGPMQRTLYPSIATQESCVACHNALQPGAEAAWRLGDVMGAFAIDAPIAVQARTLMRNAMAFGTLVFAVIALMGVFLLRERRRLDEAPSMTPATTPAR